jgi:hypothetical protein
MSDALLWKLLGECRDNREHIAQIVPYHNNEPFTDRRLADILAYICKEIAVPVELSTNASLASPARAAQVIRSMAGGTLRVSFFGATKKTYEHRMERLSWDKSCANIETLIELRNTHCPSLKIEIVMVAAFGLTHEEVERARQMWEPAAEVVVFGFLDRAGNVQSNMNTLPLLRRSTRIVGCDLNRPFERININAHGRAVLCSQDWKGEVVLGNLNAASIAETWNSTEYERIRAQISGKMKAPHDMLCRACKLAILE